MNTIQTKQLEILAVDHEKDGFEEFLFKKNLSQEEIDDCKGLFQYLKSGFGGAAYQRFLKYIKYAGIREEREAVVLLVQNDFMKNVIIQSYFRDIASFVYNNFSTAKKIEIVVKKLEINDQGPEKGQITKVVPVRQHSDVRSYDSKKIDESISFENFIFGDSNKLAYWASKQASEMIASNTFSIAPCFCIFGPVGMGKTHLMKSIAHYVIQTNDRIKIDYLSAEEFKESYIDAVRRNDLFSFKRRFADLDALLMDDVQFICSGSGNLEKEFARILNHLIDNRKWIVIACDRPPSSLKIDDRTRSRIAGGFKASIQPSDFDLRLLILQAKIKKMYNTYEISNDVLEYIADNVMTSIRELESILHNIISYAKVMRVRSIEDSMVREIIGRCDFKRSEIEVAADLQEVKSSCDIAFDDLLNTTCSFYGITKKDLLGSSRIQKISRARALVAYVARGQTAMTLKDIGEKLSRNHATVLYLINLVSTDQSLQAEAETVIKKIK